MLGAEEYARTLGIEPHRDLERCRGQLGASWSGPRQIVFGYHGKPLFVPGPYDTVDVDAMIDPRERSDEDADDVRSVALRTEAAIAEPERRMQRGRGGSLARPADRVGAAPCSYDVPPVHVPVTVERAPADAPRGTPTAPASDSLLRVMEPYIPWPPAPDELDELGDELSFGATVWNATTQSTDPTRTRALLEAVIGMFSTGDAQDEATLRAQVADIADRKQRLCPDDPRQILRVDVVPNGRNVEVFAMTAWYTPAGER